MNTQTVVFERDNKQVIQEQNTFFARVFEGGEIFESQDFNTLEKAKLHLGIEPTTAENKKLIAEFLEFKIDIDSGDYMIPICFIVNGDYKEWAYTKHVDDIGYYLLSEDQMCFDYDWNWLMSVVDKIEATKDEENNGDYYVEIYTSSCMIFSNGDYVNEIVSTSADTKIEAVYQAVVEFINNYNTQE
jgi:hypothetical protein